MIMFGTHAPSPDALRAIRDARESDYADPPLEGALSPRRTGLAPIRLEASVSHQWPPRDQFGRGTCVAFATLAAVELHRALRDDMPPERLSEQFLHERMIKAHKLSASEAESLPEGGVLLRQALKALEQDGVIGSDHAPYRPIAVEVSRSDDEDASELLALGNRITSRAYGTIGAPEDLDPERIDPIQPGQQTAQKILDFLKQGLPVAIGVPLFQHSSGLTNWVLPATMRSGIVLCPDDAQPPPLTGPRADGHVVCITGFLPASSDPLGGWFVFRNSWGLEFGSHSVFDAGKPTAGLRGFGLISATHVNNYCWEYLVPIPDSASPLS